MFAPPSCPALSMLADQDTKSNTGATVAVIAVLAELQHAITQLIAYDPTRWRCNRDGGRIWSAILRRSHQPRPVPALYIATTLAVVVPARPGLALCADNSTRRTADDCANSGTGDRHPRRRLRSRQQHRPGSRRPPDPGRPRPASGWQWRWR